jgi:1-deoxy-D-xylulose-5-phosphate reductoisomerase
MKRIAILGSTGSIGTSTLQVVNHLSPDVKVVALAAHSNIELLEKQIYDYKPSIVAVYDKRKAEELRKKVSHIDVIIEEGMEGMKAVASYEEVDFVVSSIVGMAGLIPTIAAIEAGKDVGLANKEVMVAAGALVTALARERGVKIIPIDSEHNAVFQCLYGESNEDIRRVILTASGGPFFRYSEEQLKDISVEKALNHPTWSMGPKVTVDSSTLMNKGLEVIEAYWLFSVPLEKIDVVIHPQSIIHSMVEFVDGSVKAQLNEPSMTNPILNALTYPERVVGMASPFDFAKHATLSFFPPDTSKFRCLDLAYQALKVGGSMACYMNAANEVLVQRFLSGEISWKGISESLESLMQRHEYKEIDTLEKILSVDEQARREALVV